MPGASPEWFSAGGATLVAESHRDATGPTFLLLHGIGMGRAVFTDLIGHLRPHGEVIAVDLPGYGDAPEPTRTLTMERTADLIAAYLRHRARGPVVVIGHSMGSQVATEIAARHPDAVACLVLVGPTVDRRHRRLADMAWRLTVDLLNEHPRVLLLGAREYLRAGPHLRGKARAMLAHRPEAAYPRVRARTLVLRGEHDRVAPQRWCNDVASLIPDARVDVIDGHGHETLIRDSAPSADRILAFVAG